MSIWTRFKRWVMTRYYWYFAPYDKWTQKNGSFTYANSSDTAFNLVAPGKPLQNPPPDLSWDEKHADGILLKQELNAAGFFDNPNNKNIENLEYVVVMPLVKNVDSITMKLYKNE
jgi:hypothetical protein